MLGIRFFLVKAVEGSGGRTGERGKWGLLDSRVTLAAARRVLRPKGRLIDRQEPSRSFRCRVDGFAFDQIGLHEGFAALITGLRASVTP